MARIIAGYELDSPQPLDRRYEGLENDLGQALHNIEAIKDPTSGYPSVLTYNGLLTNLDGVEYQYQTTYSRNSSDGMYSLKTNKTSEWQPYGGIIQVTQLPYVDPDWSSLDQYAFNVNKLYYLTQDQEIDGDGDPSTADPIILYPKGLYYFDINANKWSAISSGQNIIMWEKPLYTNVDSGVVTNVNYLYQLSDPKFLEDFELPLFVAEVGAPADMLSGDWHKVYQTDGDYATLLPDTYVKFDFTGLDLPSELDGHMLCVEASPTTSGGLTYCLVDIGMVGATINYFERLTDITFASSRVQWFSAQPTGNQGSPIYELKDYPNFRTSWCKYSSPLPTSVDGEDNIKIGHYFIQDGATFYDFDITGEIPTSTLKNTYDFMLFLDRYRHQGRILKRDKATGVVSLLSENYVHVDEPIARPQSGTQLLISCIDCGEWWLTTYTTSADTGAVMEVTYKLTGATDAEEAKFVPNTRTTIEVGHLPKGSAIGGKTAFEVLSEILVKYEKPYVECIGNSYTNAVQYYSPTRQASVRVITDYLLDTMNETGEHSFSFYIYRGSKNVTKAVVSYGLVDIELTNAELNSLNTNGKYTQNLSTTSKDIKIKLWDSTDTTGGSDVEYVYSVLNDDNLPSILFSSSYDSSGIVTYGKATSSTGSYDALVKYIQYYDDTKYYDAVVNGASFYYSTYKGTDKLIIKIYNSTGGTQAPTIFVHNGSGQDYSTEMFDITTETIDGKDYFVYTAKYGAKMSNALVTINI